MKLTIKLTKSASLMLRVIGRMGEQPYNGDCHSTVVDAISELTALGLVYQDGNTVVITEEGRLALEAERSFGGEDR